ncbi:DUF547 domain-containing protein [Paraglaciecola sp. MB-3u-78]|uniref:DUF547 domain-containing protein n=1 Tax=Paraglaciecola sp. MB-3u-78 TaxID=2058332 RepID=UPI000C347F13|nr:DUF547 domain-containing protein [Paraglaciecola sp. MB-3u-78]PKG97969.1 DUF547 domain-containing protein [Paraglaciecola sp. MB-3u-78]
MSEKYINGKILSCLLAAVLLMNSAIAQAFDHQHHMLTQVLSDVVMLSPNKKQTRVDYGLLSKQPDKLNEYLTTLSLVKQNEYQLWTSDEQLSFLINAYNGFTLQLINQNYAKFQSGKVESIKDLGSFFSSPWKKSFFTLLDEKHSLDDIEHNMIRVWFERPRIHAALVCAAVSCPPLRNQAFVADSLNAQLDDQIRQFLSDDQRNSINVSDNLVYLSAIFKWYGEDFEKGQQGFNSLKDLIKVYQEDMADDPQQLTWLQKQNFSIRYLDYDWRLNDISTF